MDPMPKASMINASIDTGTSGAFLPLGALNVAAALEARGIGVSLLDYQLSEVDNHFDPVNFKGLMERAGNLIGVSCMSLMLPVVVEAARMVKEERPDVRIVLGGPGPTGVAEELVRHFPFIDVVVRGEGDETAAAVFTRLADDGELDDIPGITYPGNGGAISNPAQRRIEDLDALPLPAYHLLDMARYDYAVVSSSRGCPYKCTFCDVGPLWQNRTRNLSIGRFTDQVESLVTEYGKDNIVIMDDTFVLSKLRVKGFCDGLGERGLDVDWGCFGRMDLMDGELMRTMRAAGCTGIFYGVESGSDRVLRAVNKRFDSALAARVLRASREYFDVKASFIWGFPFETLEDYRETVMLAAYAAKLGCDYQANLLVPLPMSRIYEEYREALRFPSRPEDMMVSGGYFTGEAFERESIQRMIEQIRSHPSVFPVFYYYDHETLGEKRRIDESLGLSRSTFRAE